MLERKPRPFSLALIIFAVLLSAIIGWHLYLTTTLSQQVDSLRSEPTQGQAEMSLSVNPWINLVSITVTMPPEEDQDNPYAGFVTALGDALVEVIGPGLIEREINISARESFDVYAILVPYKVRIVVAEAGPRDPDRLDRD